MPIISRRPPHIAFRWYITDNVWKVRILYKIYLIIIIISLPFSSASHYTPRRRHVSITIIAARYLPSYFNTANFTEPEITLMLILGFALRTHVFPPPRLRRISADVARPKIFLDYFHVDDIYRRTRLSRLVIWDRSLVIFVDTFEDIYNSIYLMLYLVLLLQNAILFNEGTSIYYYSKADTLHYFILSVRLLAIRYYIW